MPRKKEQNAETSQTATATAVAQPDGQAIPGPMKSPAYIDGPPVAPDGTVITTDEAPPPKSWGDPYKALFTAADFEMGENRRFKQRVFVFKEKPTDEVLATLKDNGFTYRANEKAWTIRADADTRRLADDLARQFAGATAGMSR